MSDKMHCEECFNLYCPAHGSKKVQMSQCATFKEIEPEMKKALEIKDSGERRSFDTGAVRDISEGKGRCDLLPLGVISEHLNDSILLFIETYIRNGDCSYLWDALDAFIKKNDTDWPTALLEVSKQYEGGAIKYEDRNWEKGIPVHCYIDSGVRHYLKVLRGDDDEPHNRAFIWNLLGAIWTHENKSELIDLPFKNKVDPYAGHEEVE